MADLLNLADYERVAKEVLSGSAYDYIAGGAADEKALTRQRDVLGSIQLRPRMMTDVSTCSTETTLLGAPLSAPIMIAPTGDHGIAHPQGELETARGAAAADTTMIVSCGSTYRLEEIASASSAVRWMHLPLFKDGSVLAELVARAEANDYRALCLTVDHKITALRERNIRNSFSLPPSPNVADLLGLENASWAVSGGTVHRNASQVFDLSADWGYVTKLVSHTSLPVVVKGVLSAHDARMAVEHGAAAVVVSDHGGRQLDCAPSPIEVLPEVVQALDGSAEVLVDGGFRRGTEVLAALALGAKAVLIGRSVLYGLAVDGAAGVTRVLEMLRDELWRAMVMCGAATTDQIDRSLLYPGDGDVR